MFGNSRRLKLGSRCWYTVLSHLTNRKIQALIYSLFWEVASPGGWGNKWGQCTVKDCSRSSRRDGSSYYMVHLRARNASMWWEEQGVPLAQSASPPPHWFTAETRQQIKSGLTRKLKRRPSNGLEVARGKQYRSNHLLLLSSYTE